MRFLLNQTLVDEPDLPPDLTVLEYLREQRRLTGTKEGCASGDCGACTVVVASSDGSRLQYQSINSCIALMGELNGRQLITVEHLADGNRLHCSQQAMVDCHGSQCGFCTPGFVMSLFALTKNPTPQNENRRQQVERYLGGNLCRCTGYRPIVDAAIQALDDHSEDQFDRAEQSTIKQLAQISPVATSGKKFYQPETLKELVELKSAHPDAPVVAGCTDFGLEITQRLATFDKIISTGRVAGFDAIREDGDQWRISAGCTIDNLRRTLGPLNKTINELLLRYGSTQVRNQATVGGNIGNASPIGDLPPLFIALDATVVLQSNKGTRQLPLEDFFIDYKKTARKPAEVITEVSFPKVFLESANHFKIYKISKRIDDDISTVCGAFHWVPGSAGNSRLIAVFGGMAAIPKRATALEAAAANMAGANFDALNAALALHNDFSPIDDARGSAEYRLIVAKNLFRRFVLELASDAQSAGIKLSDLTHV